MIKEEITSLTAVCRSDRAERWYRVTISLVQTAQSSHTLQTVFGVTDKYWPVLSTELFAAIVQCLQHRNTLDVGRFAHPLRV